MNKIIAYIFIIFMLFSCVETYDTTIKASNGYIVVDGRITDLDEKQSITIFRTSSTAAFSTNEFISTLIGTNNALTPITGIQVQLIVNASSKLPETIAFTETEAGVYQLPADFRGKVGNTYQIKFRTYGFDYQSSEEKMLPVPSIKNIYDDFNPKGITNPTGGTLASNDIYIDFDDPASEANFYQWKWLNWEIQSICASCKQGRYYWYPNLAGVKGDCFPDPTIDPTNIYDYPCLNQTWDIFRSSDINILSDVYTNGQAQKGRVVAQIPLRQLNPFLVAIQQMSLTPGAFRYFKLIESNVKNTGTLADTPPSSIKGNITNTNYPTELVIGYFSASSVFEKRYMLDRRNTKGGIYNNLFFYQTSRVLNYDPYPHPQAKQSALGVEGKDRTIIKPKGWIG